MIHIKLRRNFILLIIILLNSGCSNPFSKSANQSQLIADNCPDIKESFLNQQATPIDFNHNIKKIEGKVSKQKPFLYTFHAQEGQQINYNTNDNICVSIYDTKDNLIYRDRFPNDNNNQSKEFTKRGKYKLLVSVEKGYKSFNIKTYFGSANYSSLDVDTPTTLVYNTAQQPNFKPSQRLNDIVNSLVKLTTNKGLPTTALSITLIDVNTGQFSGYQQEQLRYPASVVKLFWMVAFYAQQKDGRLQTTAELEAEMEKMIKKSDNESSSRIVDHITNTKSGETTEDYQTWLNKRETLNHFFQVANYNNININQKTFPIPYLKEYGKSPLGYEKQMRGNPEQPTRNKISTQQAARLMYEIVTSEAVSQEYSRKMQQLITQDLNPEVWKNIDPNFEFNPIRAFFGQGLPSNVQFLSKAGWTSQTRQEVAFINDGNTSYILAIFAEDKAYATNAKIFPEMSKLVHSKMRGYQVADTGSIPSPKPRIPPKPKQITSQPQFQSSQSFKYGWMRLGIINKSQENISIGEPLGSNILVSPPRVPSRGELVTVVTEKPTSLVNIRRGVPQPPNYNHALVIDKVKSGDKLRVLEVISVPRNSNQSEVWAKVKTP